jgi:alanine dehydrogenase
LVLLIRDEDVRKAFTFEDAIQAVEDVYRQHGKGLVQDTPRREVRAKGKNLLHAAIGATGVSQNLACLEEQNLIVIGHIFWYPEKPTLSKNFPYERTFPNLFHVIDANDGKTLAIVSSCYGIWMRTGVAGAVGAKYLARENSSTVGIIGTGEQGRAQLLSLSRVRKIKRAFAHSGRRKDPEYAKMMSERLDIEVVASETIEEVVRNSDILTTVTRSTQPLVKAEWVRTGTHLNSLGADDPHKVELDAMIFKKADKVYVDSERYVNWVGQVAIPIKQGILRPEDIDGSMSQVIAGLKPARQNDDEITVFANEGTNMQTAAVTAAIYRKVHEMGLGIETSSISPFFMIQ